MSAARLTAASLAELLRAEGLPCVRVVAEETAGEGEGLRIVEGSSPVRVFYDMPDTYAALRRRDGHVIWLADWTERHRMSVTWLKDGRMDVHDKPWPATYMHDGHEVFRATGRRVDADLGSWVTLWYVKDADAWADWIEADVAAEIARMPKARRFATYMQQQHLDSAKRIRENGPKVTVYCIHYGPDARARAEASAWSLTQSHPNPGVKYPIAPITATGTCVTCYCPMIYASGQWWHHTGNYPAECPGPRPKPDLPLEPGEWEINGHTMTCGYCGECVSWPDTQRSWVQLTGIHSLAVHRETGELVVLAEVTGIAAHPGQAGHLVHECKEIPTSVYTKYAADIAAVLAGGSTHGNR